MIPTSKVSLLVLSIYLRTLITSVHSITTTLPKTSLSLPETSGLIIRIAELIDLIAAHDKLVKTFLVPIARAAIDDCEHARAVVHPSSPRLHPGMHSIEDAGLAMVHKKEGEAMLELYQSGRNGIQNLRQHLKDAFHRDDYLSDIVSYERG